MHDSDENPNNLDKEIEEFDAEDDFFDGDWEDLDDIDPNELAEIPETPRTDADIIGTPYDSIEVSHTHMQTPEHTFGSKEKTEPLKTAKTRKKRPVTLLVTILIIILAVGLTAYNTLRPSLLPDSVPVIKIPGSPEDQNSEFIDSAQKRMNEILEKEKREREAANNLSENDLNRPFEEQDSAQSASVLTPLPNDLDEKLSDLPPLEDTLEDIRLGEEELVSTELSGDSELIDSEEVIDPFSDNAPVEETPEEGPYIIDVGTTELKAVGSSESLAPPSIDDVFSSELPDNEESNEEIIAIEKEKAEEEARKAAQKAEEEEAQKARQEAKEAAARKAEQEAIARAKAEEEAKAKAAKQKAPAPEVNKTVKSAPAPQWEIRGIRPGRAVLYDKVTGNIEAVEPGSKLRGLGNIKEITKKDGRWVILGSEGNLSQ